MTGTSVASGSMTGDPRTDAHDPFQAVLLAFVELLNRDANGVERPTHEREALLQAARDMLGRQSAPPGLGMAAPDAATSQAAEIEAGPADPVLRPGQVVAGVFTVIGPVSRGGLGELYRARHHELGTDHALKVLQTGFNRDPDAVALLKNEARLLAMVRHDGVVGGQGLLRDGDGRLVLVMDFLRGPNLARVLRGGALPLPGVVAVGLRLAAGLGALHERGIVHQDVAPSNIVLCDEQPGGATLVDLGIARLLGELSGPHDRLDFAGKLSWASPEQLGLHGPLGIRSDLYSLGLVLAAASMGEKLLPGDNEVVARRGRRRVPPLDRVPPPLRPLLARLLQPAPDHRPANAAEVAAALADIAVAKPRSFFRRDAS